ncbi:hypothetical protein BLS_004049 [Venturia inaequalis]|uniref:Uncharacterized protein n=1 Tax=Venturia inaequalis TaxID=5025 RepID=A0A8H3UPF9_VENIN|nr:hypothetical protein BLS_004049 [Venturia inaequalis]KAE9988669.1 hypothetical protein EG328_008686 [Venturia inaequalis]KAE9990977.1 hypothetical protein EG327_000690 [Venturia inaequalis]
MVSSKSMAVAVAVAGFVSANANANPAPAPAPAPTDPAQYNGYTPHMPKWAATVAPDKLSALQADMHSLGSSIKGNKLYTSMTAVMATAVPESFKEAIMTNPESVHSRYKTEKPEWYKAIPTDVQSFMEDNRKKAKSIFTHDIGPLPTRTDEKNKGAQKTAAATASPTGKQSSEADSLRVLGAGCAALFGAFGIAALML